MTIETKPYQGVYVAMNSCYDEGGRISTAAVRKNARFLAGAGVQGLYIGGSSGEGFLQTLDERKQVLEAVLEEVGSELTVIAQVGCLSTADSVELAAHAAQAGAHAISSVPPFYYAVSEAAVERHWLAMIEAAGLPFIMYHIPAATNFRLSAGLFGRMLEHPLVAGLKITTPSTYELQRYKALGGTRFTVFNGPDEQFLAGRMMGADAGIGGTYGIMPELFVRIERAFRSGDIAAAQRWQFAVNDIIEALLSLPVYGAIKALLQLRGLDCGAPRLPLEPIGEAHRPAVEVIHARIMREVEAEG
ncbi:dihydrodipicolinate synthase family protein [Paenibacillus sp. IB182496]|uniref:Dihydrodipicolinate synthase family protein n=1 Tax=Paenibacillus sabuli TaxID=2772509 RepID=A0A927C029_9BACL|nr:dihydrodipicolinate synthase family protein [Paenibacillus sabuli]MBD2848659.1 dihydrodipicolinate synthase family protein [Paenibacillus sabuli]